MFFRWLSFLRDFSTSLFDIKSISIKRDGILVFLSTDKFLEYLTPRLGVSILVDRLLHRLLAKFLSLLFSLYSHTSHPFADELVT